MKEAFPMMDRREGFFVVSGTLPAVLDELPDYFLNIGSLGLPRDNR